MDMTPLGKRVRFKHHWFGSGESVTFVEGIVEGIKGVLPDENVRYAVRVVNVPDRVQVVDLSRIRVTAHDEIIECIRDEFEVID